MVWHGISHRNDMFSCTSRRSIALCESGSAEMRRGKISHCVDLTTALWGSRSECHEVSEARYSNSHLVVVGNCPLLFVRSVLVHPLPMYYCATHKRETQAHTCSGHWGRGGGGGNGQLLTAGLLLRTLEVVAEVGHGHLLNMVVSQEN